jgi:hypothetical protein
MVVRIATGILGVLLMGVGLATVYGEPFLGWLDVSLGILILLSIAGPPSAGPYGSSVGPAPLGGLSLLLATAALFIRPRDASSWWTLAIAVALVALGVPRLVRSRP